MPRERDLIGLRFERLTVIKQEGKYKNGARLWLCKCDCGNEKIVAGTHLVGGKIRSCGCLLKETTIARNKVEKVKHGKRGTRLYIAWRNIKDRCLNPNEKAYPRYGGRGITICPEWMEFEPFYEWAITHGYADNLTIDRIDNDGNYEPGNCRWTTRKEQANNRRSNVKITFDGKTKTLAEWADYLQIPYSRIEHRYKSSMPIEKILYSGNLLEDRVRKNNKKCQKTY